MLYGERFENILISHSREDGNLGGWLAESYIYLKNTNKRTFSPHVLCEIVVNFVVKNYHKVHKECTKTTLFLPYFSDKTTSVCGEE